MKKCETKGIGGFFYCVSEGETLADLEGKFLTTKNLIIKENKPTKEVEGGDMLYIKTYSKRYTVTVEDTPFTLEEKLGVPFCEIVKINKITFVYPYMVIVV